MKVKEAFDLVIRGKPLKDKSISNYRACERIITKYFDELPIEPIKYRELLVELGKTYAEDSVVNYFNILHSLFAYLEENFEMDNPMRKVPRPPTSKKQRRYFTPDQIIKIINACVSDWERALILTLIDSGCRIGDCANLLKENVYSNYFLIKGIYHGRNLRGKTGQLRYRLNPELCKILKNLNNDRSFVFARNGSEPTSKKLQKAVTRIIKRAGFTGEKLGAHTIRHSVADLIATETGSALTVKAILQHEKIQTSMLYIHDAEERKAQDLSPLELVRTKLNKPDKQDAEPYMPTMFIDNKETLVTTEIAAYNANNQFSEERESYVKLIMQDLKDITPDFQIRPLLKANDMLIIQNCMLMCIKSGVLKEYEGQAIGLLKRMTRKV